MTYLRPCLLYSLTSDAYLMGTERLLITKCGDMSHARGVLFSCFSIRRDGALAAAPWSLKELVAGVVHDCFFLFRVTRRLNHAR